MTRMEIHYVDFSTNSAGEEKIFSMTANSFEEVNMAFQDEMDELGLFENKDYIVYHRQMIKNEQSFNGVMV